MAKYTEEELKEELENSEYKYGFYTDIESDTFPKGLSEEVVIALSKKKNELLIFKTLLTTLPLRRNPNSIVWTRWIPN